MKNSKKKVVVAFFYSPFDVRKRLLFLFFPNIFHNSLTLCGIGLSRNQMHSKQHCSSWKFICIWVSFHSHLALFIEYKRFFLHWNSFSNHFPLQLLLLLLLPLLHHQTTSPANSVSITIRNYTFNIGYLQ